MSNPVPYDDREKTETPLEDKVHDVEAVIVRANIAAEYAGANNDYNYTREEGESCTERRYIDKSQRLSFR